MKAIRVSKFGGPEVLQFETNVKIPEPLQNQVLIKVQAIGVNPVDTYIRSGTWVKHDFPYTPGSDAAGIVSAVGPDVSNVKVGDRVFTCDLSGMSGSYAEYMLAPSSRVWHLPERLSFSQGAALGVPYFTVIRALKYKMLAKPNETILIHGASGGVGLAACQIAKGWGLDVVGTASTEEGTQWVKSSGARVVLNHKDPHHHQNLRDATNGKGYDIILEMLANVNLPIDMEVINQVGGRIGVIGARGKVQIDARLFIHPSEISILGVALFKSTEAEWIEMGQELEKGMDGQLKWINPVVDQEIPLERAVEAHKAVLEHPGGSKGKIALIP